MKFLFYIAICLVFASCDAAFSGGGFSGGGGGSNQLGDQAPGPDQTNPNPTPDQQPPTTDIGDLVPGSGGDRLDFQDMTAIGKRLDGGLFSDNDHSNVQIRFYVNASTNAGTTSYQSWPETKKSVTLEKACPPAGATTTLYVEILDTRLQPSPVKPSKRTNAGGPIGYQIDDQNVLMGYEREGVNNFEQISYHNNDDAVIQFSCPQGSGKIVIENLCLDQRIPANGSDLHSDNETHFDDSFGRMCAP